MLMMKTIWSHFTALCLVFAIWCSLFELSLTKAGNCSLAKRTIDEFYKGKHRLSANDKIALIHGSHVSKKCKFLRKSRSINWTNGCAKLCKRRRKKAKRDRACKPDKLKCVKSEIYRSADGSCNNLHNPTWGQSDREQGRLLKTNAYEDGKGQPRQFGCNGKKLTSPREISTMVHKVTSTDFEKKITLMAMSWGQFLAHEIVITHIESKEDGEPFDCCGADSERHECIKIDIPANDDMFTKCMPLSRSVARLDCNGVKQQINSNTPFIDGSAVYGSTKDVQNTLRDVHKGLMLINHDKLPVDNDDSTCELRGQFDGMNNYCPLSGDLRSSEQVVLTSVHTLFVREHNRLAKELYKLNPHWENEQIFQEARKIVAAQLQLITYREYLTVILGKKKMKDERMNIEDGYKDTYNRKIRPTVFNELAAAGLRFGHSQVHNKIGRLDAHYNQKYPLEFLRDHFFNTHLYHENGKHGLEQIIRWYTFTKCPVVGRGVEDVVRQTLFPSLDGKFDLVALNIQRAREHGVPGYNKFRKHCGLKVAADFNGLVDIDKSAVAKLKKVYRCVGDIDLFTGALAERPAKGAPVGPLLQCLLAKQYKVLRDGDRFWFERPDPKLGFKPAQLKEIKKTLLSSIICANTDSKKIQKFVFCLPNSSPNSGLVNCSSIEQMDLSHWKDSHP